MVYRNQKWLSLFLVTIITISLVTVLQTALADNYNYGNTSKTSTFYVTAESSSSYIQLESIKGTASVNDNWSGQRVSENHYGFYKVNVSKGSSYSKTYSWVPDATNPTKSSGAETGKKLKISFPSGGTYTITITPMSRSEITSYWLADSFYEWTTHAQWELIDYRNCSLSSTDPTRYSTGTVSVKCYDSRGNFITSYTETLTASGTVKPQSFSGYRAQTSGEYVTFDPYTGLCNPSSITFYYDTFYAGTV